jgi:hypothetical protein
MSAAALALAQDAAAKEAPGAAVSAGSKQGDT